MNHSRGDRRAAPRRLRVLALCIVLAVVAAACGSSRRTSGTTATTASNGSTGGPQGVIDASSCPAGDETTGISGDTITIGTSLPQSGTYAPFQAILQGERSYFQYVNDKGGVTVAGKKYKIKLVDKDDAYDAARTIANVNSLINDTKVFGLFNVVGTKNNIGIRDTVNTDCVPNMLIASGAVQWGNPEFPWMIGSELVPYPLEVQTFVEYLKQNKPNATIAVLEQNDDFGQSYVDTLNELVKGTNLKVVQTQKYDPEGSDVKTQVTSLAGTHADAFLLAAALLACPNALIAAGAAGWKPITYMSGTCVSKVLFSLAGDNANNVLSVTPLLDPADPTNASNAAMQLYKTQVKKYASSADTDDGIVAYGWTTAALFVKTLELSPKLDRVTVMNAVHTLPGVTDIGLQIPNAKWTTSASDRFIGETFQMIKYDAKAKHTNPLGPLIVDDGKTASLSPHDLLNS
jgi:branched-chain amino acid transport system substrate-binding protein